MLNSLPNNVVHAAEFTDILKKQLDKFWSNQEIIIMPKFKELEAKL